MLDPRCKLQYFRNAGWNEVYVTSAEERITWLWKSSYKKADFTANEVDVGQDSDILADLLYKEMYGKTVLGGMRQKPDDELS